MHQADLSGGSAERRYDVVVVGGGMAGSAAALVAARSGRRVLLIEQNAFLGGAATAGMVGQFVGWRTRAGRQVIRGIAEEITDALQAEGGCGPIGTFTMSTGHIMDRVEYDAELLKIVLDRMLLKAGVDVLFKAVLTGCVLRDERIVGADLWAAGKRMHVAASSFVDASGDMSLLLQAGARFLDLGEGEALQPGTMMFSMAPIRFETLSAMSAGERDAIVLEGVESGALPRAALHYSRVPGDNVAWFNISRVTVDPDDPFSISRGEIEGRRQALSISRFITDRLPGCEKARLNALAPQLGVRDTRRVRGDYVLTRDDVSNGTHFPDTIAAGAYPIDIHRPNSRDLTFVEFPEDHHYCIPLRALIPAGLRNVLSAGRGISATHEAFAALRVMPSAMAMGHAAGIAAALAADAQGEVRAVDPARVQRQLRDENAYLGD